MIDPQIKFCISNLAWGSQKAFRSLDKDPNLSVTEYPCLRHCGQCARQLFAEVDGRVVTGRTADELIENVYDDLDEHFKE
ncbi:DUF1450 domain-containing protein [Sporolactobacillus putidus]|uniref:UPF0349 protein YuzB n=1 Tax=Sporolactobacillus putidus TaxID=492735 RepID=A0A917W0E3_9BACL|nr:DUF1450 domain-containing protein [Sporolactobacillus putidus]GGL53156.1 UPF0349 protein YuzB [Sporolactobacillus putidus]